MSERLPVRGYNERLAMNMIHMQWLCCEGITPLIVCTSEDISCSFFVQQRRKCSNKIPVLFMQPEKISRSYLPESNDIIALALARSCEPDIFLV